MKKFLFITVGICLLGAGVFAYGNMPQKKYHANGVLKSEVPQSFFMKKGIYKEYNENGQLIREVSYQNNVKSGLQKEYFPNGVYLESHYVNGQKEGESTLYFSPAETYSWHYQQGRLSGHFTLFDNLNGTIDSDNNFVCYLSSDTSEVITGTFLCKEDEFVRILLNNDLDQKRMDLAACVNIEHVNYTQKQTSTPVSVSFDGGFTFPEFTELSSLRVSGDPFLFNLEKTLQIEDMLDAFPAADIAFYQPRYLDVIVQKGSKNIKVKLMNADDKQILNMAFDSLYNMPAYKPDQESKQAYQKKVLFEVVKNMAFKNFNFFDPTGKVDAQFQGKIHLLTSQIDKASRFDIFNPTGQSIVGLEKTDKGLMLSVAYPQSGKKMLSLEVSTNLPDLEAMRKRLNNTTSFEEAGMILFSQNWLTPTTQNQIIRVPHFEMYDINGNLLIQTQNLVYNLTAPEGQRLRGDIRLNKSEQEQAVVHLTDNFDQIEIEKKDGETVIVDSDGLLTFLQDYFSADVQENTIYAYRNELDEQSQMESSLIYNFFQAVTERNQNRREKRMME